MRVDIGNIVWEMPQGGDLFFWMLDRVPECPNRACRRARKCVGAEIMPRGRLLGLPSCRMVRDWEWDFWTEALLLLMARRSNRGAPRRPGSDKEIAALCEKHLKIAEREWEAEAAAG